MGTSRIKPNAGKPRTLGNAVLGPRHGSKQHGS
jgi:hypothetical protein